MPTPLAALAGFAVGKVFDNLAAEKQQSNYEQNQASQQKFTREMAVDATPLAVLGMRKAGLNPAVMSSPMSPVSAPSVSHGAAIPTDITPLATLAGLEIQKEVADAQVDKLNAETQHQRIINIRENTADDDFNQALIDKLKDNKALFQSLGYSTEQIDKDIAKLEENPTNLGTFVANMSAIENTTNSVTSFVDKVTKMVELAVKERQLFDKDLLDSMSKMESRESLLLARKISTEIAQKYYLTQVGDQAKENIQNLEKEREKIDAEIDNLGASSNHLNALANKVSNEDVNTLIANGEIGKALIAEGTKGVESFSHGLGQGTGLIAGARLMGMTPANMVPTSLGKMAMPAQVGKTALAKTSGKVADKLSKVDSKTYSDLVRYYGKQNANRYLNGYLNSKYGSFNAYLDAMQKMAKKKK